MPISYAKRIPLQTVVWRFAIGVQAMIWGPQYRGRKRPQEE
jgi:peptidoglycan/LPS O-acetylase OafA/YrhL